MALTLWWLLPSSTSSFTVRLRCDANDLCELLVADEVVASATANTSVADGIVTLKSPGHAAGQRIPFTLRVASSVVASGTGRTYSETAIKVVVGSCCVPLGSPPADWAKITARDADLFVLLGDLFYENAPMTANGITTTNMNASVANTQNKALRYEYFRQMLLTPDFLTLIQTTPYLHVIGDHEIWNDIQAGTDEAILESYVDAIEAVAGDTTGADLAAARLAHQRAVECYQEYALTPDQLCTDPGIDTIGTLDHPCYFRYRAGPLELWALDGYSHRSSRLIEDAPTKVFDGPLQLAWLESTMLASTAPWKMVGISTQFWKVGLNSDTYVARNVNLGYRYAACDLVWATRHFENLILSCGDQHHPAIQYMPAGGMDSDPGANGRTGFPSVLVPVSSPIGRDASADAVWDYVPGVAQRHMSPATWNEFEDCKTFEFIEIDGSNCTRKMIDHRGRTWWQCSQVPTSREPIYTPTTVRVR